MSKKHVYIYLIQTYTFDQKQYMISDKYSDIYFDSDEEDSDQRKVVSNDELLYDPEQDDEDQSWVDSVRKSYQVSKSGGNVSKLPNSDAVLNCPACFTGRKLILALRVTIGIWDLLTF